MLLILLLLLLLLPIWWWQILTNGNKNNNNNNEDNNGKSNKNRILCERRAHLNAVIDSKTLHIWEDIQSICQNTLFCQFNCMRRYVLLAFVIVVEVVTVVVVVVVVVARLGREKYDQQNKFFTIPYKSIWDLDQLTWILIAKVAAESKWQV